jgi:hypothetical protein
MAWNAQRPWKGKLPTPWKHQNGTSLESETDKSMTRIKSDKSETDKNILAPNFVSIYPSTYKEFGYLFRFKR